MAKFRKSLHFDELESSESDREENLVCEDRDLSPPAPKKQRRRQSKPRAKLREYDTEGSNIDNIPEELYWCIVEWDGENTYDCLRKDKLTALEGDLKFKAGENVLAVHRGKPFKARLLLLQVLKAT